MIGKTVSHYKILEKLGEGGMGEVFLAEDTKLDRRVALKFLPSRIKAGDSDRQRFLQEAKAAAALNHPNVCVIHDISEHESRQFIVMEYVQGQTLKEEIRSIGPQQSEPIKRDQIIAYALQIADALHAAHQQEIIHRDIKSENIMVTAAGQIKIMDFGLAKLKGSVKLTKTSSTAGTVAYMSPETIQGREADARADIFSFGIVLYEMLTGRLPFQGEYEAAMIYSILNEEPEPIQKHLPDLSSELLHILNRGLEKDPEDRYQSMKDLLIDLKRLQRDAHRPHSGQKFMDDETQKTIDKGRQKHPTSRHLLRIIFGLIVISAAIFLFINILKTDKTVTPFSQIQVTRVTSHGNAKGAAISPDGKYIVHVLEEKGKQSLWLRQVATGSNVEILPPSDDQIYGLTFSRDGDYIHYILLAPNYLYGDLYRLPVLGGAAIKILDRVDSPITFSPDDSRFAFIRMQLKPISSSLIVFDTTERKERTITTLNSPKYLGNWDLSWSPDGEFITGMLLDPMPGEEPNLLVNVSVADGSIKPVAFRRWGAISQFAWLSNGSGLVISAADKSTGYIFQLWYVSFPGGGIHRITSELNNYMNLGLTEDMNTILTTRSDWISNIWTAHGDRPDQARQISFGKYDGIFGIAWCPDGRIVYATRDWNLWIMNQDGSGQRLLTTDENNNGNPAVSPDGRYIVFQSWRGNTSTNRIWRMDIDGSNAVPLTEGEWDNTPRCTPDGKWVVYKSETGGKPSIWKVPIEGGESSQLFDRFSTNPAVSNDGRWIACYYWKESDPKGQMEIAILPIAGGEPAQTLKTPYLASEVFGHDLDWTADGQAIIFASGGSGTTNIWRIALDGSPPVQLTHLKDQQIYTFDWSKDGTRLAYARGVVDDDVILIRDDK